MTQTVPSPATLYVVGLGPGQAEQMTPRAVHALESAAVVVGYTGYVEQIPTSWLAGKTVLATGMMAEVERCRAAMDAAMAGQTTALVCSGDPGVYALAGLVLELVEELDLATRLPVDIVPGIPAVCAAAAVLGAPLTHDFACVSLSDLLTPWERIERRVRAALEGDFVLVIYNPRSQRRHWQFERVCELVREYRGAEAVAGVVRQAGRNGQQAWTGPVAQLDAAAVDMLTIIIFGNATSRVCGTRMITPRGYLSKYTPTGAKRGVS